MSLLHRLLFCASISVFLNIYVECMPQGFGFTETSVVCRPIGCYPDTDNHILSDGPFHDNQMTLDMCHGMCTGQGFRYFALEHDNNCFCGQQVTRPVARIQFSSCNSLCAGNPNQFCGGVYQMLLYDCG